MFIITFSCSAQMASWQHEENKFIFVTSFSISDPRVIHGRTHQNKIKKSYWQQELISKSLLPQVAQTTNKFFIKSVDIRKQILKGVP